MKKISLFFILFTLSCAPTIKKFDNYQKAPLLKADFMPSQEMVEGQPVKVAVFPFEIGQSTIAKNAELDTSMAINLESLLTKDKLVELIDRNAYKKLKKEVILAEMAGEKAYEGPVVADYIISGSVSMSDFTSRYVSAKHIFNTETGRYTYIPPKWRYVSEVNGNIKVYQIPSLNIIKTFEFKGEATRSENTKFKVSAKTRDDYLVKEASKNALENSEIEMKNFFAKKGFILEKRILSSKIIFKISLGSDDGIKQGDRLAIYSKREDKNPLTNKSEIIEKRIVEGRVSDIVNKESSWVVVDSQQKAQTVRLGDLVKIEYKKSFWKKAGKVSKGAGAVAIGISDMTNSSSIQF